MGLNTEKPWENIFRCFVVIVNPSSRFFFLFRVRLEDRGRCVWTKTASSREKNFNGKTGTFSHPRYCVAGIWRLINSSSWTTFGTGSREAIGYFGRKQRRLGFISEGWLTVQWSVILRKQLVASQQHLLAELASYETITSRSAGPTGMVL